MGAQPPDERALDEAQIRCDAASERLLQRVQAHCGLLDINQAAEFLIRRRLRRSLGHLGGRGLAFASPRLEPRGPYTRAGR